MWELKQRAEAAEEAGNPAEALKLYEAVDAAENGSPLARIARARITWLRERSVNDFGPLSELLRIRHEPATALTDERLEAFAHTIASWPPGIVRIEAQEWLADAWTREKGDPARAARAYRLLLSEPGLDVARRQLAASRLAEIEADQGKPQEALALLRDEGFAKTAGYAGLRAQTIQRAVRPFALAALLLFVLVAAVIIVIGRGPGLLRRSFPPWLVGFAVYVIAIPCFVSVQYSPPMLAMYQWLGGLLAGIVFLTLLAAGSLRTRTPPPWARPLLATTSVTACLSAGFLAMEHSELLVGFLLR